MKVKRFVIGTCLCCAMLSGASWSTPERVVPFNIYDGVPNVIIDNEGVAWCILAPWVSRFSGVDNSWQLVSDDCHPGGLSGGNSACFDKGDTLWVFDGNQDQIYYVRYYGGNWSDVDTVRAFPGGNSPALAAVDSAGGVWVCWVRWAYEVACNRYKDGEWDEPQLIPDTMPGQDWGWDVTTDALGRVWFFWYIVGNESNSLHCRYNDNGTWSEQMLIRETDVKCYLGTMDFAPDREGGIWAVWSMYRGDSIWVEAGRYKDGTWGSIDTVANAGIFSGGFGPMPKIAVDAYGRAWAVWRQAVADEDSYGNIYYSFNAGSGWSTPAPVDTNPAVDQLPDIAVDGASRVWCVWSSSRGDSTGVWASYATGAGIEEPVTPVTHTSLEVESFTVSPRISYSLPPGQLGTISIYDVAGRKVENLKVLGSGEVKFSPLTSGVYFVRLNTGQNTLTSKAVVLR